MNPEYNILFAPYETAGQMWGYASGLRSLGIEATTLTYLSHSFEYPTDIDLDLSADTWIEKLNSGVTIMRHFPQLYANHDIFHFWAGRSLLPRHVDLPLYKIENKKLVMNYRGSHARLGSVAKKQNPYEELMEKEYDDEKTEKYLKRASKYIDIALVPDHELYPSVAKYFDHVEVVRRATDTSAIEPTYPDPRNDAPIIAHAPSNRANKGTRFVLKALSKLEETHDFELTLIENSPHEEVIQTLQQADIVVDQLLRGTHGVLSIEAMAAGTPTVCYLRDDLIDTYPGSIPIVNANPNTVKPVLSNLIEHPQKRKLIGEKSREYVVDNHDKRVIAEDLIDIYNKI
ncbi:glycosyltransferase [Halorubrum sp. SD626R]|uniref:glycosyltransferase family protein n=1 Tax=Halorubrum sp. SD626R TaxID=1419722 RepID=UPI0010F47BC2|nr:glycosyltransferase [Halorubrum sp. SD626R]TKX82265.1 glycosyltransferase family 1 protein [Halorubrum sp. SD626R]